MAASVAVLNAAGEEVGTVELPADLFDVVTNVPLIHQVVVAQRAAARQGTHDTKTRGEVSGGGKKPYKQKGTGRARQGSTRAPQFTGGGVAHGPHPRKYDQRTPKKMKAAALRSALSDRARYGRIHVVSTFGIEGAPKTRAAVQTLAKITNRRRILVVVERDDELAIKSLRNIPQVHLLMVDQLNTYDVIVADDVVFTQGALDSYVARAPRGKAIVHDDVDQVEDVDQVDDAAQVADEPEVGAEPGAGAEPAEDAEPAKAVAEESASAKTAEPETETKAEVVKAAESVQAPKLEAAVERAAHEAPAPEKLADVET